MILSTIKKFAAYVKEYDELTEPGHSLKYMQQLWGELAFDEKYVYTIERREP